MHSVLQDIRFEVRQLLRKPGFTAVAILTLALGAGANALMFTVIDSVLLQPLPYPDSQDLVSITGAHGSVSLPNFLDARKESQSFSGIAAYTEESVSLRLPDGEAIHSSGVVATANLFKVLGVAPMLGAGFAAGDDQAGKPCSVILSAPFWREHFSANPGVLGQSFIVNGRACRISGVIPNGFGFPSQQDDFWTPLQPGPDTMNRGTEFLNAIGRLKAGVSLETAQTELKVITARLEKAYPNEDKGTKMNAELYLDTITGPVRPALIALLAAVAVLLLIACANIANLQLARALGRKREMAIRAALGAGRMRVARQLFMENMVLALAGTSAGLAIATGCLGLLKRLAGAAIPWVKQIHLRAEVCLAMLIVAGIAAVLFGLAPIWQAARQDIETALRESAGAVAGGRKQQRLRNILVVAQLSLAIVLLAGSGMLVRTLYRLLHTDSGFVTQHVLTMQTALSGTEPAGKNIATTIYAPELDAIERLPGVQAAGFITFLPLGNGHASSTFSILGRPRPKPGAEPSSDLNTASDDFFRALRIPLIRGRFFAPTDTVDKPRVAIINDVLARRYFSGQDPIGQQIAFDDPDWHAHPATIVGVVRASRQLDLAKPADPELYLDFRQVPPGTLWSQFLLQTIMTYVVRTSGDPAAAAHEIQGAIHRVDPAQTIFHVATMQEIVSTSVEARRLGGLLLSVFAGLALAVAAAGLYGVLSYLVTQRRRDIAVRMALGARRDEIVRMIVSHALLLYAIGLGCGIVGVIWCGHVLANMLPDVHPWDPIALGITTAVLLAVSVLAAWFPARRAGSIDPYHALRSE